MLAPFTSHHWCDSNGNPAGGCAFGPGFAVSFQNGPLGRGADRKEPNGAFVETLIAVAADRLGFYQLSKFACADNAEALEHLQKALEACQRRTQGREARQVEGTHQS